MNNKRFPSKRNRGSALLAVLIFTMVLLILVGSLLRWSTSERRYNIRGSAYLESRNAAEALAEYGFSQIRRKFETRSTFSLNPSGADALRLPPSSFWTGSNVQTATIELIGGTIQNIATGTNALYFVDPNDPNNEFDPLKNKWVFRRDVSVIAKVTVTSRDGGPPITSYATEKISVRGAPLFAHAIFYNMDMEIFPGPTMNIYGPVHVNGNLYCSSQGNQLNFRGPVTVTGHVFHAWKSTIASTQGTGSETLGTSPVRFPDRSGNLVELKTGAGVWNDSTMGGSTSGNLTPSNLFRAYASQTWNGNLQTSVHGIQNYTPLSIGQYKEDTTPSDGIDQSQNSGRAIIEHSNWPTTGDADYDTRMEIERQKYANDAGIYIKVRPGATLNAAPVIESVTARSKTDPTKLKALTLPSAGIVTTEGYATSTVKVNSTTYTTTVTSGMFDRRRNKGTALVEIDIAKLRDAVTEMAKPAGSRTATKAITNLEPEDWTGIVYVEIVGADDLDATTQAPVYPLSHQVSVRLINGTGKAPSYGTANPGLTIATNGPVYIKGNYNADGNTSTSGGINPACNIDTGEVPCAIAADAITVLSESFSDSISVTKSSAAAAVVNTANTSTPTATTTSVEIAAAFLMGSTPTNKSASARSSGGVHNFPRFLENWGSKDVWIRGSLVSLFESRVAAEPWNTSFYSPPNRNWGFNDLFRNGVYPPGTPKVLSYRRVDFTELTPERYTTIKNSFSW